MRKNDEPKLDLTKPMRPRNGNEVRILCTDGPGDEPIVGFYNGDLLRWSREGFYLGSQSPCHIDLVNVLEKRTVWVFEFIDRTFGVSTNKQCWSAHLKSRIRVEFESGREDE